MERENELPKQESESKEATADSTGEMTKNALAKIRALNISRQNKRLIIFWVIVIIIGGGSYYFKGLFIAATVDGSPVSRWSIISELEKKAGKNALDTIITKKLIENEMKKSGIIVKGEDIDAEMNTIEAQLTAQGLTLDQALSEQGMTAEELRAQLMINKGLEQILADKIAVSDEEINQYLSGSGGLAPQGTSSDDLKNQAREQLKGQKFNVEAAQWVGDLRAKADIRYYTQY